MTNKQEEAAARERRYAKDGIDRALWSAKAHSQQDSSYTLGQADRRPQAKRPCSSCPYRKDKPHILTEEQQLANVTMIHYGQVQSCHAAAEAGKGVRCSGALRCLRGGDDLIVSPNELGTREPATFQEACDRWPKPKQKLKNPTPKENTDE